MKTFYFVLTVSILSCLLSGPIGLYYLDIAAKENSAVLAEQMYNHEVNVLVLEQRQREAVMMIQRRDSQFSVVKKNR